MRLNQRVSRLENSEQARQYRCVWKETHETEAEAKARAEAERPFGPNDIICVMSWGENDESN